MTDDALDLGSLARWQADPAQFIADVIHDPHTGRPFDLLPAEVAFLDHCFRRGDNGKLTYPEQIYSCPKKSGKTAFAALLTLTAVIVYGGAYAEAYCIANDFEQAAGRVFKAIVQMIERSPKLRDHAKIFANKIEFPDTGSTITALASDYAGAAGANPTISVFDELSGYTSERARRLWDEMVPAPTRKTSYRLTVTYAGFSDESLLLEEIYKRGLEQPKIGTDLRAGDDLLMFWSHDPIAPWQDADWLRKSRSQLRPNAYLRLIENRFVTNEQSFIELPWYDRCVDPERRPLAPPLAANKHLPRPTVWIAVDASVKRDATAIVVCTYVPDTQKVHLVDHRIFQPTPNQPLDFEATIEKTILDYAARFSVVSVRYDPFQMHATAMRLRSKGVPMVEFPQIPTNLTAMGSNLYELIRSGGLVVYPDDQIRLAISRACAKETDRGPMITKSKASHKIDVVIALAMAAFAAVESMQNPQLTYANVIRGLGQPSGPPGDGGGDQIYLGAFRGDAAAHFNTSGEASVHNGRGFHDGAPLKGSPLSNRNAITGP